MPLTVAFDQPSNLVRVSAIDTSQEEAAQFPQIRPSCEHTAMPADMKPCRGQLKRLRAFLNDGKIYSPMQQWLEAVPRDEPWSCMRQFSIKQAGEAASERRGQKERTEPRRRQMVEEGRWKVGGTCGGLVGGASACRGRSRFQENEVWINDYNVCCLSDLESSSISECRRR